MLRALYTAASGEAQEGVADKVNLEN